MKHTIMKISGIIAVAVAAAFIAIPSHAQSRAQLQKDNQSLRHELDSLKAEMEKMREELRYTESQTAFLPSGMSRRR